MKTRVPSLLPLLALALLLALACGGRLLPGAAAADAAAGLEEEAGEVMEALKEAVQVGWVCCSVGGLSVGRGMRMGGRAVVVG